MEEEESIVKEADKKKELDSGKSEPGLDSTLRELEALSEAETQMSEEEERKRDEERKAREEEEKRLKESYNASISSIFTLDDVCEVEEKKRGIFLFLWLITFHIII